MTTQKEKDMKLNDEVIKEMIKNTPKSDVILNDEVIKEMIKQHDKQKEK